MCLLWNIVLTSLFLLASAAFGQPYEERPWKPIRASTRNNGNYKSTYTRSQEVEEKCNGMSSGRSDSGTVTSSSSSTQDGPLPTWAMLSFQNGEWEQAAGSSPLLPFQPHGFEESSKVSIDGVKDMSYDPIQFASFRITDMNQKTDGKQEAVLQVSAVLQLAVRAYQDLGYNLLIGRNGIEEFLFNPGSSLLTILLEGLYTENEVGRSLCMLGCTLLPHRSSNVSNPWSDLPLHSMQSPPTKRTCNLMLQLHYPKEMSLTSRAIRGVLKSLSSPGEWSYFDPISFVSQMGADASYQFRAGGLVEAACKGATPTVEDTEIYRGDQLCATARESLNGQQLEPLFNWRCNKSDEYCTKLGPFQSKGGLPVPRNGSKILIQDVRCVDLEDELSGKAANISAVFRGIPPRQDQNLVFSHTGLNGLTLVAEGMWWKSSGKLCMIACANGSQEDCTIKICLYIPTTLSITQRNVFVGTISSLDGNDAVSFDPLSLHQPISSGFLPRIQKMLYKYTRINDATDIMKREEPLGESKKIRPSMLKYPTNGSYRSLSRDLTVDLPIISQSFQSLSSLRLEIIAIEDFVVSHWTYASKIYAQEGEGRQQQAGHVAAGPQAEGKIVKVAAELQVRHSRNPEAKVPVIHGEGLYNPRTGKMYMVGCRDVSVTWKVLQNNNFDLVDGLDCNVEVIVRFPPKTAAWLVDRKVSVTITSHRTENDPFFTPQVTLKTIPNLNYEEQWKNMVFRKNLEGGLSLVTLSFFPMCIASQLIYIRKNKDLVPFISLVMLGVQAMGYGIPLIAGDHDEAFFAKLHINGYHNFSMLKEWTEEIMFVCKLLILAAFLLNLYLCQTVVKARIQLRTRRPLEPGRVPSERKVVLIFLLAHAIGFLLLLTINTLYERPIQVKYIRHVELQGSVRQVIRWLKEMLMVYRGLIQDLFLLPQVLGGAIWHYEGKPLRNVYYIGLTISCMLPRAYDTLTEPLFNPYFAYANLKFDFYSWGSADVGIPLLALLLAIAIYVQQRWKILQVGSNKLRERRSSIYERLPSKLFEAELMPNFPLSSSHKDSENGNGHLQESTS
ncbi:hypothetical protein O6H91_16G087200 [Diphasiastrum complanatum]|nr:hypothetical protein O6H91_16G087200 [Diphasiastrum complanatum]